MIRFREVFGAWALLFGLATAAPITDHVIEITGVTIRTDTPQTSVSVTAHLPLLGRRSVDLLISRRLIAVESAPRKRKGEHGGWILQPVETPFAATRARSDIQDRIWRFLF